MRNSYETPCGHRFHMNCLMRWRDGGNISCPMCRKDIFEPERYYFPHVTRDGEIRMVQVVDQDIISWLRMMNLQ